MGDSGCGQIRNRGFEEVVPSPFLVAGFPVESLSRDKSS